MRYFHLLILLLALAVLAMVVDRRGLPWSGESLDPCTEPLAWHIGTVDPRFGLSEDQVRGAVLEAAAKWEAAGGRPYFRPDTTGMAIDLVYDHRQESMETHGSAERRVRDLGDRTASYRARVESLRERLEADRATHERQRTDATARRLQASVDRHNRAVDQYNLAVERYNTALEEIQASGPAEVRAADLQSTSRTLNGAVISVERTLTVGVVGSHNELVRVLTHELGHALGLGHVAVPDAVMAEAYRREDRPVMLHDADREALLRRCGSPPG